MSCPSKLVLPDAASRQTQAPASGGTQRIAALDFTKGILVLLMVVYHWLNYFVSAEGSFYKYLRFLTPSFIFITGFLVSHVYLRKYQVTDARLPKRLLVRGLKLVGIFVCLNLVIGFALRGATWPPVSQWAHYLTGSAAGPRASFSVLLPIGYVLLASAGLSVLSRWYRHIFHVASTVLVLGVLVFGFFGFASAFLELISIGLLGVTVGHMPPQAIRGIAGRSYALLLLYAGYLCAITIWNEIFVMQIAGVCLNLTLIYRVGGVESGPASLRNAVILLGKYSLLAYIAHIVILQALHGAIRHAGAAAFLGGVSLPAAAALTLLAVAITDRARARAAPVNKLYTAVFA